MIRGSGCTWGCYLNFVPWNNHVNTNTSLRGVAPGNAPDRHWPQITESTSLLLIVSFSDPTAVSFTFAKEFAWDRIFLATKKNPKAPRKANASACTIWTRCPHCWIWGRWFDLRTAMAKKNRRTWILKCWNSQSNWRSSGQQCYWVNRFASLTDQLKIPLFRSRTSKYPFSSMNWNFLTTNF